ncbi:ParB N-terminal domain-containing protein [Xanthomonas oryzae]|uniref:ParB N-terminal domain-containing protein n=1 Tax=Xanthomonas oryzae TaxID=347 RepID=UPI001A923464|nr:ParB N-terminal domain-containing protein [Xanthomonas oryzae]
MPSSSTATASTDWTPSTAWPGANASGGPHEPEQAAPQRRTADDPHRQHRGAQHALFHEIVGNIRDIGLKKPITVTPRPGTNGGEHYLLICGAGRLKAYKSLKQDSIPALVVEVGNEEAYIMSLTENIARRKRDTQQ